MMKMKMTIAAMAAFASQLVEANNTPIYGSYPGYTVGSG